MKFINLGHTWAQGNQGFFLNIHYHFISSLFPKSMLMNTMKLNMIYLKLGQHGWGMIYNSCSEDRHMMDYSKLHGISIKTSNISLTCFIFETNIQSFVNNDYTR